ncbi:hypothetical protein BREU_3000 [Bifidobacterium reuteri DSM 23975]|uniref:Uncharacterized protein n=1 Tax=Bifidobacterium reuteri DSM 23975 TaxID=1437610 RepID=A0A087CYD1_9BIFI|nr:hypothetical protein BREU_3000 [Bifidobacterium reuteri DSM 23975]
MGGRNAPVTTSQRGNISGRSASRPGRRSSVKQNIGYTGGMSRLHRRSGAEPRFNGENAVLTAPQRGRTSVGPWRCPGHCLSAGQYPGRVGGMLRSPPLSGAEPRVNRQVALLTASQRGNISGQSASRSDCRRSVGRNLGSTDRLPC